MMLKLQTEDSRMKILAVSVRLAICGIPVFLYGSSIGNGPAPVTSLGGIPLPNPNPVVLYVSNSSSGNNDFLNQATGSAYTVPSGKRTLCTSVSTWAASNTASYIALKNSGTYYPITSSGNATPTSSTFTALVILENTMGLAINTTGTAVNARAMCVEFDTTSGLKMAYKLSSWSAADNTIYTVPAGKHAILLNGTNGNSTITWGNGNLVFEQATGATPNYTAYAVKSGDATASTNEIYTAASVGQGNRIQIQLNAVLNDGDFVVLNTSSNNSNQIAFLLVFEFP